MKGCSLISPDCYNALPTRDATLLAAQLKAREHKLLRDLITVYGLDGKLSVCLLHKQPLDIPKDRVVVYRTTPEGDVLCGTQRLTECQDLRGYRFRSTKSGTMSAYEFTTEPVIDLSLYADFASIFSRLVHDLRVQDIFGFVADEEWESDLWDARGQLTFGFTRLFCPWPPSVGEHPDCDDWTYCASARALVAPSGASCGPSTKE